MTTRDSDTKNAQPGKKKPASPDRLPKRETPGKGELGEDALKDVSGGIKDGTSNTI